MKYIAATVEKLNRVLNDHHMPLPKKIHRLRVTTKKLRALWRLTRVAIEPDVYAYENARLRALAQRFGERRDHEIILQRLHKLKNLKERDERILKAERKVQRKIHAQVARPPWAEILHEIDLSASRLQNLPWKREHLRKQVDDSLNEARKEFKKCLNGKSHAEDFHEWRKRTKALMYQIEFLKSLGARYSDKSLQQLKSLADDLGKVHDLTVLCTFLKKEKVTKSAIKQTREQRRRLEKKSLANGCDFQLH